MKSTLGAGSFIRHNSAMLTRLHKYAQPPAFHPSRFSSPFGNEIEDVHGYGFKRNYRYTGYHLGSIPQGDFPTRHCLEFRASLGRSPAWGGVLIEMPTRTFPCGRFLSFRQVERCTVSKNCHYYMN